MTSEPEKSYDNLLSALRSTPDLDDAIVTTYVRLWQLETWLRRMVYAELRTKYGDLWSSKIEFRPQHVNNDKTLTHMITPETTAVSYATFGSLCKAIINDWELFKSYLPPQSIWAAKIEEVSQIRNRVAHFRTSHRDDLQRVSQLLRDIDEGMWRFCTSFNSTSSFHSPSNDSNDPVIYEFSYLIPYGPARAVEYQGDAPLDHLKSRVELSIRVNKRPWNTTSTVFPIAGTSGMFYDISIVALNNRRFRTEMFLDSTKDIHQSVLYIALDTLEHILRIMLPAVLGKEYVTQLIDTFIQSAANSLGGKLGASSDGSDDWMFREQERVQRIADSWPEYVIGPTDPITFLDPEMPCSMFGA